MAVTVNDLRDAIGVDFNSVTDEKWALACLDAAKAVVRRLPIDPNKMADADIQLGLKLLALDFYRRRPDGAVAPDFDYEQTLAGRPNQGIINQLLRAGGHAIPVIA